VYSAEIEAFMQARDEEKALEILENKSHQLESKCC